MPLFIVALERIIWHSRHVSVLMKPARRGRGNTQISCARINVNGFLVCKMQVQKLLLQIRQKRRRRGLPLWNLESPYQIPHVCFWYQFYSNLMECSLDRRSSASSSGICLQYEVNKQELFFLQLLSRFFKPL